MLWGGGFLYVVYNGLTINLLSDTMPRQKLYPDKERMALSVRLPEDLYDQVQRSAQENRRSMNQEIVWLVQKALEALAKEQKSAGK